jgi:hypothetical protein
MIAPESKDDNMSDIQITTYGEPRWGAKAAGMAQIRKDSQAHYYVNNVSVIDMRVVDLFTVLTCADNTTHYVLTAFFQRVDRRAGAE